MSIFQEAFLKHAFALINQGIVVLLVLLLSKSVLAGEIDKAQSKASSNESAINKAGGALKKKYDKFDKITWFEPRSSRIASLELYYGIRPLPSDPSIFASVLRIRFSYMGESWIFLNTVKVLANGDVFEFPLIASKVQRETGSSVWEKYDAAVDELQLAQLEKIVLSKKIELKFQGEKNSTEKKLSAWEIKNLKTVLDAYKKVKALQ